MDTRWKDLKIIVCRIMSLSGDRSSDEGFLHLLLKHCTAYHAPAICGAHQICVYELSSHRFTVVERFLFESCDVSVSGVSSPNQEFLTLKSYKVETSIFTFSYICRYIMCTSNVCLWNFYIFINFQVSRDPVLKLGLKKNINFINYININDCVNFSRLGIDEIFKLLGKYNEVNIDFHWH